jgi:hypothetical protein
MPTSGGGRKPELEIDRLSNIIKAFIDRSGTLIEKMETEFDRSSLRKLLGRWWSTRPARIP